MAVGPGTLIHNVARPVTVRLVDYLLINSCTLGISQNAVIPDS